jgi:hypothetical protein
MDCFVAVAPRNDDQVGDRTLKSSCPGHCGGGAQLSRFFPLRVLTLLTATSDFAGLRFQNGSTAASGSGVTTANNGLHSDGSAMGNRVVGRLDRAGE